MAEANNQTVKAKLRKLYDTPVNGQSSLPDIFHVRLFDNPNAPQPRDREDDRATAIMVASAVERALETAIRSKLRPDVASDYVFGEQGPLNSLSAKIRMAFALDLFGASARDDLEWIRHIRNAFAHCRGRIYFDTPEVAAACDRISVRNRWPRICEGTPGDDGRELYIQTCVQFVIVLGSADTKDLTKLDRTTIPGIMLA